jgi:hypothetical protein
MFPSILLFAWGMDMWPKICSHAHEYGGKAVAKKLKIYFNFFFARKNFFTKVN